MSLLPLDVGFDLKAHDMAVTLPAEVGEVVHLDQDGKEAVASGSRAEIVHQLRQAGYNVNLSKRTGLNGPWTIDRGQLRDKDGNSLASFPIHPGGLGGPEDSRNGGLCALLPQMIDTLAALVDRCDHAPILAGNEGLRGPLLAEAKTLLHKIGLETARPAPGATCQGWLTYRGVPMVLVAETKDRGALVDASEVLLHEGRVRGKFPEVSRAIRVFDRDMSITGPEVSRVAIACVVEWLKTELKASEAPQ